MVDVLGEMIKANTTKKDYKKVIYYEDIVTNELNKFPIENIDELKETIRRKGLLNDLIVKEFNGKFKLIGGERRYRATVELINEGEERLEDIPCHVIPVENEVDERLLILMDNLSNRSTISKDLRMMVIEELDQLWKLLGEQGNQPSGTKRDWIASMLGISARTAQYYLTASKDEEMVEKIKSGNAASTIVNEVKKKEKEDKKLQPDVVFKKLQGIDKYLNNLDFDEVFNRCNVDEIQKIKAQLNNIYSIISEIRNSN